MITGNITGVKTFRSSTCPANTTVIINKVQYAALYEDSIIDCNSIDSSKTIEQLSNLLKENKLTPRPPLNDGLIKKLTQGVLNSPVVTDDIKEVIRFNQF